MSSMGLFPPQDKNMRVLSGLVKAELLYPQRVVLSSRLHGDLPLNLN
jgi:hypothetical protein